MQGKVALLSDANAALARATAKAEALAAEAKAAQDALAAEKAKAAGAGAAGAKPTRSGKRPTKTAQAKPSAQSKRIAFADLMTSVHDDEEDAVEPDDEEEADVSVPAKSTTSVTSTVSAVTDVRGREWLRHLPGCARLFASVADDELSAQTVVTTAKWALALLNVTPEVTDEYVLDEARDIFCEQLEVALARFTIDELTPAAEGRSGMRMHVRKLVERVAESAEREREAREQAAAAASVLDDEAAARMRNEREATRLAAMVEAASATSAGKTAAQTLRTTVMEKRVRAVAHDSAAMASLQQLKGMAELSATEDSDRQLTTAVAEAERAHVNVAELLHTSGITVTSGMRMATDMQQGVAQKVVEAIALVASAVCAARARREIQTAMLDMAPKEALALAEAVMYGRIDPTDGGTTGDGKQAKRVDFGKLLTVTETGARLVKDKGKAHLFWVNVAPVMQLALDVSHPRDRTIVGVWAEMAAVCARHTASPRDALETVMAQVFECYAAMFTRFATAGTAYPTLRDAWEETRNRDSVIQMRAQSAVPEAEKEAARAAAARLDAMERRMAAQASELATLKRRPPQQRQTQPTPGQGADATRKLRFGFEDEGEQEADKSFTPPDPNSKRSQKKAEWAAKKAERNKE